LNQTEIQEKQAPVAKVDEATKEVTIDVKSRNLTKTFTYDAVYGPSASQRDLYNVRRSIPRTCCFPLDPSP